jgi:seipin
MEESADALLFLARLAGCLVRLVAFLRERITSAVLSLFLPVAALIGELCALPGVVASNICRGVHLCRPCICVVCVCAARLCSCPALGRAVEEPVTVRQPLYFDYTEAQPSATVTLGGALEWEVWRCSCLTPTTIKRLACSRYMFMLIT